MQDLIERMFNIISGEKRDYDLAIKIAKVVEEIQKDTAKNIGVRAKITSELVIGEPKDEYGKGYRDGLRSLTKFIKLLYGVEI